MQIRNALLNGPLGFGGAPLGNMFHNISDEEGDTTVDTAWDLGTRYFDTAPFYGAGLSEIRLGRVLAKHKRSDYLLSTKVGRLILDEVETRARDFGEKSGLFEFGRPNKIVYDYSADGTKRSIDDSLKRLGVDHIDFAWVHDIAQDFHGDAWLAQFDIARTGAFRVPTQMREQGMIKGWGLGVNRVEPCELLLDLKEVKPDGFLLAGRYTLLDHQRALQRMMPKAAAQNIDIVVGDPYSSGILAGGAHFEYQQAPPWSLKISSATLSFSTATGSHGPETESNPNPNRENEPKQLRRSGIFPRWTNVAEGYNRTQCGLVFCLLLGLSRRSL
jgi:D-threo-aldose 1-dehydrogenase